MDNTELSKKTVTELRKLAQEKGIKSVTKKTKADLIKELIATSDEPEQAKPQKEEKPVGEIENKSEVIQIGRAHV